MYLSNVDIASLPLLVKCKAPFQQQIALLTNRFPLAFRHAILNRPAEYTAGGILLQDYLIPINEYLQGITVLDTEGFPDFHRNNDPPQIINFPHYACAFHVATPFFSSAILPHVVFGNITSPLPIPGALSAGTFGQQQGYWPIHLSKARAGV